MSLNRLTPLVVLLFSLAATAASAQTPDEKKACVAAFDAAQTLKIERRYIEANAKIPECLAAACPEAVSAECAKLLDEVQKATPSVVPRLIDGSGQELVAVTVTMDGKPLTNKLDGSALPVDPGLHTFVFDVDGKHVMRKVTLADGEKHRILEVKLAADPPHGRPPPPPPPPPREADSSVHPAAWVLYGVAALGVGAFIGFGVHTLSIESELDACTPNCDQGDVDDLVAFRAVADVSLGVGALALAAAIWVTVASLDDDGEATASIGAIRSTAGPVPGLRVRF